jgi:hypothetical protein
MSLSLGYDHDAMEWIKLVKKALEDERKRPTPNGIIGKAFSMGFSAKEIKRIEMQMERDANE